MAGNQTLTKEHTMTNEIVKTESAGFLSPVVSVSNALLAYQAKKELIDSIMKPGVDYGIIPGTTKNTLLKAGAEKATSFFGLAARFRDAQIVEDFTGKDHDGEPFFFYRRTCELWRGDYLIASVDGSCNSFEKKYRFRSAERVCPHCGKSAIIKGKAEYGGGWVCFDKKGGCKAKFADNDPAITSQETGQVKNPDLADQANTILKMADKRALVAATLIATGLSEYFTQDVEDFITVEASEVVAFKQKPQSEVNQTDEAVSDIQVERPVVKQVNKPNEIITDDAWENFSRLIERANKAGLVTRSYNRNEMTASTVSGASVYLQQAMEKASKK
jgi:hypothetical protein